MARSELNETIAYITGPAVPSGSVAITKRDGTAVTVYAASTGAAILTQPLAIVTGEIEAWLDDGSYVLTITIPNQTPVVRYVEVVNGQNLVNLTAAVATHDASFVEVNTALALKQSISEKSVANGYAALDAGGLVVHADGSPVSGGSGAVAVEAYQDLTPYLGPGWLDYNPVPGESVGFYIDRERVFFRGVIVYYSNINGADATRVLTGLPVGYRPSLYRPFFNFLTDDNETVAASRNKWWKAFMSSGGELDLSSNADFLAGPNFGGPPDSSVFQLFQLSFRIN